MWMDQNEWRGKKECKEEKGEIKRRVKKKGERERERDRHKVKSTSERNTGNVDVTIGP